MIGGGGLRGHLTKRRAGFSQEMYSLSAEFPPDMYRHAWVVVTAPVETQMCQADVRAAARTAALRENCGVG